MLSSPLNYLWPAVCWHLICITLHPIDLRVHSSLVSLCACDTEIEQIDIEQHPCHPRTGADL